MTEQEMVNWLREAETVGDILKRLRQSQALTLQEIADYTGLAKSYISMLEHGQKMPERDTLVSLLLAAFSLSVPLANRVLLFAGFAPFHYRTLARRSL
jgi:transcriptional regulator with XRE-family HTH domain